ncbi:MAG: phosphoribosylamine--glycine ligase [Pyrinomonadaceae bacterium]
MNILVIGSGGREHAICDAFSRCRAVEKIYCANGNAGIESVAVCVPIRPEEIEKLADFAHTSDIDLTFVGGETSLAMGIVDSFETRGLRIIGASREAARLEASKAFSKDFMSRHAVPTAMYKTANSAAEAAALLNSGEFGDEATPVVVKADGLAAGKGVVVARDRGEAIDAIGDLAAIAGEAAAARIVLEECLFGREVSLLMFADGEDFALMPPTRDHKRIGEGDTGPNTGGMGTFTDASLLSSQQTVEIVETIIKPTLRGCIEEGFPFRGILFLGLMMTAGGPRLLEYNVRFGDPETQSILVRLETDLVDICEAMLDGRLGEIDIKWKPGSSATVVLAAKGYPLSPQKGDVISGLDDVEGVTVFHAGTARNRDGAFITAGGRVLGITAVGETLDEALGLSYKAAEKISWDGMQYRRDIGR